MERYEVLNRALMPADELLGAGLDALKKLGYYEPLKSQIWDTPRTVLLQNFKAQNQLEVIGAENIPEGKGCIIAANHASWLDVQVLGVSTMRRLYFVAKSDFRDWPFLRRLIELNDGIYVRRGGDPRGLDEVSAAVADGKAVVIFPEGTIPGEEDVPRWDAEPDTGLLRGHTGVARVALATGAPVVPCGISGTGKAFPPEMYPRLQMLPPLPRPVPVTVRFGAPIAFKRPAREVSREDLAAMTKRVMVAISGLIDHSRDFQPIAAPSTPSDAPKALPKMAYGKSPKRSANGARAPLGVLVLHGFTSHVHCVDPLVRPLDAENLPYRFPILRGHGTRFEDMVGTTWKDWYADGEAALLDLSREVDKVVVVGLSMGGLVALDLAAKHRDKVAGVVTVAAAVRFADPLSVLTPMLSKLVKFWPSPNAYNDEELKRRENRNYPKFSTAAFQSLREYAAYVPDVLSFVKAPILILQARKDTVVAPSAAKLIHEKVSSKEKQLMWFDKCNHEMLLDCEAPAVIDAVMGFVRRVRG
ncbi:MAG: alpha/beta fold hydrolase [Deltaproteobacteria bacterium]|nr:alpha/beta fold hydrolase [Deltaproteobacteria bacterium]